MFGKLLETLNAVTLVVTFIVNVVEAVYEGIAKAGDQKKRDAIELWVKVKPTVVATIKEVVGERYGDLVDKFVNEKVIGFLIDLIVWLHNMKGLFKSG